MTGGETGRGLIAAVLLWVICTSGCLVPGESPEWGAAIPSDEMRGVVEGFPPEAVSSLMPLTKIFYGRITSRRFNSRATFEDPSVRQFFPTVASYSDYYAALVDALEQAYIRYNRPTRVDLLGIDRDPSGTLKVSLRFVGRNDLPLRWWNATLFRTDEWLWQDGRWWVVPGKV